MLLHPSEMAFLNREIKCGIIYHWYCRSGVTPAFSSFSFGILVLNSLFLGSSSEEMGQEKPLNQCSSNSPVNLTPKEDEDCVSPYRE